MINRLDRLTEPDSRFTLCFLWALIALCYVLGFVMSPVFFIVAIAMWMMVTPTMQTYYSYRSKRRRAEFWAQMNKMEQQIRERWDRINSVNMDALDGL